MVIQGSHHFSRLLTGQSCVLDTGMGVSSNTALRASPLGAHGARGLHASASACATGIPTLGETGVKFNSSRWTQGGTEAGMSVFDMKGAMEALRDGPDESSIKRAHPAQLAHAARIARAQHQHFTIRGFKVFPDLTPGRAFMWGSILAAYVVGAGAYMAARSVGVTSVSDLKGKMQEAFAPYRVALQQRATLAKEAMELKERPAMLANMKLAGQSISRQLGKADNEPAVEAADLPH